MAPKVASKQSLREVELEAQLEEARATITGLAAKLTDERHAHRAAVEALKRVGGER